MSSSVFIAGLAATAHPVKPRRLWLEVGVLALIAIVQFVGMSNFYTDEFVQKAVMMGGEERFFFKVALFGFAAVGFSGLALWSLHPGARRLGPLVTGFVVLLLAAGLIGFDRQFGPTISASVAPEFGVRCLFSVISLALPVTLVLAVMMQRGASTQPNRTALAIGLAGGSWGAFTYAVQCPFVGLYYLGTWYVGGILVVTLLARWLLPKASRW